MAKFSRSVSNRWVRETKQKNLSENDIEQIFNIFTKKIISALNNGNNVEIRGFGTLRKKTNKAKEVRNPKTEEKLFTPLSCKSFIEILESIFK